MIVAAAIIKDDIIYTGRRHHEILQSQPMGFLRGCRQGFITDDGVFVDRVEAFRIAIRL